MRSRLVACDLAQRALERVPAYGKFVARHGVQTEPVDFEDLPCTSKSEYLKRFDLSDLCWDGTLSSPLSLCATSGSTGEPFYFPRSANLAEQYADVIEEFLYRDRDRFSSTLAIVGYGMGVWIAGTFTVQALEIVQKRHNAPIAILPTGVSKPEILNAMRRLSPQFDSTVLLGYPPFIRDVLVEARREGIDLRSLKLRLGFAAESFSDRFRHYICSLAGIESPYRDTFNIYGSADIGAMAFETPVSILVREQALGDPDLATSLFGIANRTPTLAQWNPAHIHFEELEGEIALTGDSALPLIRYKIGDRGGVRSFTDIELAFERVGRSLKAECRSAGLEVDPRPAVFIYERTDLSVSLYGLLVFPEYVKAGLEPLVAAGIATGRFSMAITSTEDERPKLLVHVELEGNQGYDSADLVESIVSALKRQSSEFRELALQLQTELVTVEAWERGSSPYFSSTGKQPWVAKGSRGE